LPSICVAALRQRRAPQLKAQADAGSAWQGFGLVFTTRHGTPIEPRNFSRSYDRRIGKAGVRDITVHDARRTCGTLLADLDVHPRVAMQILRHAQFSITMEIYTQVSSEATRAALKKLGESLDG
jgi:integrase